MDDTPVDIPIAIQHPAPQLYVLWTQDKGRGVFTLNDLKKGDLIEICPALVLPAKDTELIHQTRLYDYYFGWEERPGANDSAILLGFGSLYNHAPEPNAECFSDFDDKTISIVACRDISAGDEITIAYDEPSKIWFDVKK
jgi:SET domain-containing protein